MVNQEKASVPGWTIAATPRKPSRTPAHCKGVTGSLISAADSKRDHDRPGIGRGRGGG